MNYKKKFFLTAAALFCLNAGIFAQSVSLNLKPMTVKKAMGEIKNKCGYSFVFSSGDIDTGKQVTVNATKLDDAIRQVLRGQHVSYEIIGKNIILKKASMQAANQKSGARKVTGVVKDQNGEPIIGAAVTVQGDKTRGAITDLDGNFTIDVPGNSNLEISYIGYQSQVVSTKGRNSLNINMKEDSQNLDEVVVVGYTTQKKGLLTGAVETMKVSENLKTMPTTAAGNLLTGKLSGVFVSTPNSVAGSQPSISIRTGSSWNAQNVTYVIDGVVRGGGDFNNLSPNEIEDITVLKDAASAAIYGSRSAGGVIIVTTKKGTQGKPVFNYSYGYSFDSRTKNAELTNAVETGALYNRINGDSDPAGWAWSQEELDYIATVNGGWGYDQLEEVWKTPVTQTHNLSVNGGNERVRYFGAASYVDQQGFLEPMKYKKYNIRMNVTADITKDLEVFAGLAIYNNFTDYALDGSDTYGKLRIWQPDQPVYTNSGKYVDYGWIGNVGARVDGKGTSGYDNVAMLKPQAVFSATYKAPFLKGLSLKVSYSRSWTHNTEKEYYTNYDMMVMKKSGAHNHIISTDDADIVGVKKSTWVGKEYIQRYASWSGDKQFNVQLNFDRTFNDVHKVSAALVTEWYEGDGAGVYGGRETFPVYRTDQFWAASSARANTWGGGDTDWQSGRMSYIGQFNYTYANKYMVNFSFREDGSMNFAPGQRWGFFPAGSVGWVVSEEKFFNKDIFDFLKLRVSVGLTGNDSVGGWQWQESYNSGYSAFFGTSPSKNVGITYGSVVNDKLTWEKALSWNFGVDVHFLKHWSASLDYWYRNSYDILGNRQTTLPSTFSLSMPAENYGEIHAQGFDFTLGYNGQSGDFSYFGKLTASYGWNKTIKQDYAENAQWIDIPVGKSCSYITGYKFDKIIRTQEELDAFNAEHPNYRHNGLKPELGMMVYEDISGPNGEPDGEINGWDRVILEDSNDPVVFGLNIGGSWKGFSIDAMFSGRLGYKQWANSLASGVEWNRMWRDWYYDSWTPENPNATLPKRVCVNNANTYNTGSEFWLKDASHMRLKYLTLSYNLPKGTVFDKVFENVRLYATGTNLFILSGFNNKYYDPEIGNGNAFPVLRSISFGVDLKF